MKKAYIIHGWGYDPTQNWYPWLKKEMEKNGFKVFVPEMPDTENPKIEQWVEHLSNVANNLDEDTYFVGHSIGCQAILRYLEGLGGSQKIGGAIFVAPWLTLQNLEDEESEKIAEPWIKTPLDFDKVTLSTKNIVSIFSDNDPFVSLENKGMFESLLNSKTITLNKKGHFEEDIRELPEALEEILNFNY